MSILQEHGVPATKADPQSAPFRSFKDRVAELLPDGGNLSLCLACGACSASCPATGLEDMDPRKFLRLASLGMDEEITTSPWVWQCTLCMRCMHNCPMQINIPQLVYHARQAWPRETRPRGILGSCDAALKNPSNSAMGATPEDFVFVVEDVLAEVQEKQTGMENLTAPLNKVGAFYFLNQNSREPVTEPEEMPPLWKILQKGGVDWTYADAGWAAENYCLFAADEENWERIVRNKVQAVERLKCSVWLNTE